MRILKTRGFAKDAKTQGLTDEALRKAVGEIRKGLTGNAMGGNLFKKRVAVGSKGKSGGLRTMLAYKTSAGTIFCLYVFSKNQRENIDEDELEALKKLGKVYLVMTDQQIEEAVKEKVLIEVSEDADDENN